MDAFALSLWVLRLLFVLLVYLFFLILARALWRDLRASVAVSDQPLGRLLVLASPADRPARGSRLPLDAVTSIGRDVNCTVVVDDEAVAAEHALLTFRGHGWHLQDLGAAAGTLLNGAPVQGSAALGFGDEIALGSTRLRLERPSSQGGAAS